MKNNQIKFKNYQQNQIQLLPQSLDDKLPKDHLARLINQVVDDLDISFIESAYSPNGQHAYPPRMLLKILVYGYAVGIRSSRKLADKLTEDIVFLWLAGRLTPDFRTIADFRKNKLQDFKKIFEQVLESCFAIGLVRAGKVSLDGTKILANASKNKAVYRINLQKRKELIKQKVEDIIKEAETIDEEEDRLYGSQTLHRTGKVFSPEVIRKAVKKIEKERQRLEKKQKALAAKQEIINKQERLMRKNRNSYAATDKDATVMFMKEGYVAPGYNVQLATENQVIVGYGVFPDRNDVKLLKPMIKEIEERTGQPPQAILADAGYGTKLNYRYLKNKQITAFIPYNYYEQEKTLRNKGLYEIPKKPDTEFEKYKFRIRLRLRSEEGERMMRRRREDVEPVIGNLKRNLNFRRFSLRGRKKCELEFGILALAHNLKKIKSWLKKLANWDDGRARGIELGAVLGYRTA